RARQERWDENSLDYTAGVRGNLRADWKYDLTFSGSSYHLTDSRPLLLNQPLQDYFLGSQNGEFDVAPALGMSDPLVLPVYDVRWDRFYTPITPQIWQQLSQVDKEKARSSSASGTLVLNGTLLDLPAGPLATALVFEAANQSYDINVSDAMANGDYF